MVENTLPSVAVAIFGSFVAGLMLLTLRGRAEHLFRPRDDGAAIQASHEGAPLRLGGIAVLFGLFFGAFLLRRASTGEFTIFLFVSVLPVLLAGIAEDIGYRVSPMGRFLAALVSAGLAVWFLGLWVHDPGLPGLSALFTYAPLAIVATVLFAGFYCHSVNLVDGMNGLSSTVVITSALGIAFIAAEAGLQQVSVLALLLAGATVGFLALNWPKAHLLLGDAGAYGVGHVIVWLAIALNELSPATATPALFLILFWPIVDTLHTILRRFRAGKSVLQPDRMHLHQKIRRGLEITLFSARRRTVSNPLTTLLMAPMIAVPVVTGLILRENMAAAWIALVVYSALFALAHVSITNIARQRRRSGQIGIAAE